MAQLTRLGTLKAAPDNVLLQIGFFGGLRCGELIGIVVEYVAWEAEGIAITLPRSKIDKLGEGIVNADFLRRPPLLPGHGAARLLRRRWHRDQANDPADQQVGQADWHGAARGGGGQRQRNSGDLRVARPTGHSNSITERPRLDAEVGVMLSRARALKD